jgi:membrane peptidoglycan carboxypeptidase
MPPFCYSQKTENDTSGMLYLYSYMTRRSHIKKWIRPVLIVGVSVTFIGIGLGGLWVATLKMPDLQSFENRKVIESTKIYDRTGEFLLYDTGINTRRTNVDISDISLYVQKATIAIEDSDFYTNLGIEPLSIVRAVIANFVAGGYTQGASTITQQVVKNSLLTQDKTISRKLKEAVLALKLTRVLSKDQILNMYFNETAYGGTIYGVEEASISFFGLPSKNVSLAQAAYLAAIPQAPTYFSPYGTHKEALDARQRLVLTRMKTLGLITKDEFDQAVAEKVVFLPKNESGIRAPHFVMFVREYLIDKYGEDSVANGGLRVTTTLDYKMQQLAQDTVKKFGPTLEKNFNASNTAMVAINPQTGDILTMLGSRDYFDPKIDGNFNIALAKRQPGSTFKPFVYATAFKEGYTPETVLFDVETQFSTRCSVDGKPNNPSDDAKKVCYTPQEYDGKWEGPMTIRTALAHSRNVPAVKTLYLAGINDSIQTAEDLGITTLNDPDRYGLTLVLGGGEVSLLDMTSAYGVFANDGMRNPYRSVLKVVDSKGNVLEESPEPTPAQVLAPEVSRQISDILSDPKVRMASLQPVAESIGRPVAIKTGTTNDFRDVWAIGYTPNLVVGAWAGKNDNTPLKQNVAGLIIAPVWGAFTSQAVKDLPVEGFKAPPPPLADNKPVLRGIWHGGVSYTTDSVSGGIATEFTPPETRQEVVVNNVHTILHWVDKDNPLGPAPANPTGDSQYQNWEYGVRKWFEIWKVSNPTFVENASVSIPTTQDNVHTSDQAPKITFLSPAPSSTFKANEPLNIQLQLSGPKPPKKTEVFLNGRYVLSSETTPLNITFVPGDTGSVLKSGNVISVIVYDTVYNRGQATTTVNIVQ